MKLHELLQGIEVLEQNADPELELTGVSYDSRSTAPGELFAAISGYATDGHRFIPAALARGAACVLCEHDMPEHTPWVRVRDARAALAQLGCNWFGHPARELTLLAVTGTNGKTTTKELIAAVLQKKYRILYTLGNLNNHIGVPLTLLRLTPDDELAVIEMGANHPGEIKTLSAIVEPDYGIITNVGKAHLEGFGSFEGVIKTKGELYEHLRYGGEHTIFIDRDNEHLNKISKGLTCITYGTEDEAELYVSGKAGICAPFLTFEWRHEDRRHKVSTHLIGSYNLKNALAAIAIGRFFNVSEEDISKALEEYIPHNNRSQLTPTADNNLIVDAYNANPTSMMAALENFRRMEVLHKMVILGDMKELGKSSHEEHQKIVSYIDECKFERVILVGEEFGQATSSYEHYQDARQLSEVLKKSKPKGFYILIKGSNSMKLAPLQELL